MNPNIAIPKRFQSADLDNALPSQQTVAKVLQAYDVSAALDPSSETPGLGVGVLLYGRPGIGKTWLGCALLNAWTGKGISKRFITFTEYLDMQRRAMRSVDDGVVEVDLLRSDVRSVIQLVMLDDVGRQQITEWGRSELEGLLRHRYDAGLPTVVTTNLLRDDFADTLGGPLMSFIHEAFVMLTLRKEAPDLREVHQKQLQNWAEAQAE